MPRVEKTLWSYLSPEAASSRKFPYLPSKPLHTTSALVGKEYMAAGQVGLQTCGTLCRCYRHTRLICLRTMSSDDISELRRTADLALQGDRPRYWAIYGSSGGSKEKFMVDPVRHQREGQGRLCLLASLATLSIPSSTGTRRPVKKRQCFSSSCLTALQLRRTHTERLRSQRQTSGPFFRLGRPRSKSLDVHGPGLMGAAPSGEERCTP